WKEWSVVPNGGYGGGDVDVDVCAGPGHLSDGTNAILTDLLLERARRRGEHHGELDCIALDPHVANHIQADEVAANIGVEYGREGRENVLFGEVNVHVYSILRITRLSNANKNRSSTIQLVSGVQFRPGKGHKEIWERILEIASTTLSYRSNPIVQQEWTTGTVNFHVNSKYCGASLSPSHSHSHSH